MSKATTNEPIGFLLERTTRIVKLQFHKAFKNLKVDMTPEQWVVMDALFQKNDQPQKHLADSSYKNAPTISRIIDVLSKKGWVERKMSDQDRRVYIISQTKEGKAIYKKVIGEVERLRNLGWKGLTNKDYKEFKRIINQIFANYEQE